MYFTGQSDNTLDAKGRLQIPAKHRAVVAPAKDGGESKEGSGGKVVWVCIPWSEGARTHLRLYTEARFEALADQIQGGFFSSPEQAALERLVFGAAERLETDAAGRVQLTRKHIDFARLAPTGSVGGSEVVVVGVRDRLEVHARAAWEAGEVQQFGDMPALLARMASRREGPQG